jgi:hypothetical protein
MAPAADQVYHARRRASSEAECFRSSTCTPYARLRSTRSSHAWRFWTTLTTFPAAIQHAATLRSQLLPRWLSGRRDGDDLSAAWLRLARNLAAPLFQSRHGERGNVVSELWLFHPNWWRTHFRANGFAIVHDEPMGLFYTGHMFFGTRLSLVRRAQLAPLLGSACHLFKIRPLPR